MTIQEKQGGPIYTFPVPFQSRNSISCPHSSLRKVRSSYFYLSRCHCLPLLSYSLTPATPLWRVLSCVKVLIKLSDQGPGMDSLFLPQPDRHRSLLRLPIQTWFLVDQSWIHIGKGGKKTFRKRRVSLPQPDMTASQFDLPHFIEKHCFC